jgi:hypothetical protein
VKRIWTLALAVDELDTSHFALLSI